MKISQALTPAAFEFGCTSAACAPPNKKGSGGTGGSIKGQTKGGGPHFSDDQQIAALAKAMGRTMKRNKPIGSDLPDHVRVGMGWKTKAEQAKEDAKYVAEQQAKMKETNAGGGRSSMKSSVDMEKSRAIAAARGDKGADRRVADRRGPDRPARGTHESAVAAEKRMKAEQGDIGTVNDMYERTGGVPKTASRTPPVDDRRRPTGRPIRKATDEEYEAYAKFAKERAAALGDRETINDTYERTGGMSKAEQRAELLKRETARHKASTPTYAERAAARNKRQKERENSELLKQYKQMMRERNTIL